MARKCKTAVSDLVPCAWRCWQWLVDAPVARVRVEQGDAQAFRLMQQQAVAVALRLKMAAVEMRHVDIVEDRQQGAG